MKKKNNNKALTILAMVGPTGTWLILFLLIPLIYVVAMSFMTKGQYGGVQAIFSLASYQAVFDPLYMKVIWKSIVMSTETSVICLIISYPFAYCLCKVPEKHRGLMTLLIMLPFWINGLIRLNGWTNILRDSGVLNSLLIYLGVIEKPIKMMYTDGAVVFGMVYTLFPFMVLPLQTSISKLDTSLIEAAKDLGAKRLHIFTRLILPLTIPGIFAGTIQVFIPSLGAFYIADVMGGGSSTYLGNLIQSQFLTARNWPLGAVFSVLLIAFTLITLKGYSKIGNLDDLA